MCRSSFKRGPQPAPPWRVMEAVRRAYLLAVSGNGYLPSGLAVVGVPGWPMSWPARPRPAIGADPPPLSSSVNGYLLSCAPASGPDPDRTTPWTPYALRVLAGLTGASPG